MRFFFIFQVIAALFVTISPPAAQAQSVKAELAQFGKWIWGPPSADPTRPYLEGARLPNNSQWAEDEWTPQAWIDSRGSAAAVIEGFYETDIITDQYTDGDTPVLEVGQRFLDLSGQDKRRVAAFFDDTFGITNTEKGLFLIRFEKRSVPVGIFTKQGLQLQ
ncbi:MAG: hypothetical protein IT559_02045 [Alphaproteobacteria bacterium]|nr:hypothetical protein [Alphaproteobacteria bacterium]